MGEVVELSMLSPDKGLFEKLIDFTCEFAGCKRESLEMITMDNWRYEGELAIPDLARAKDLLDSKIIRVSGECSMGQAGVTSENVDGKYQYEVWINPSSELDESRYEAFKDEAGKLVKAEIILVAFIGREMLIDYSKGIDNAVETAHGVNVVLKPKNILKFAPDYMATSLWLSGAKVGMIEYARAGLSKDLISMLENFDKHVCGLIDWSDPGGPCPMPVREQWELYNEGHRLYECVKEELGDSFGVEEALDWIRPKEDS